MKISGLLTLTCVVLLIIMGFNAIKANYLWDKEHLSHWNLADKSSTIETKLPHIQQFVQSLEKSGLQGEHDAAVFKTPDNSFDDNFKAVQTLVKRMEEMTTMDTNSMAYQQAMQQITGQEQGEAYAMLAVLEGCWYKRHYWYLWDWWGILAWLGVIVMGVVNFVIFGYAMEWWY